jgi:hypothetical protein
MQPSLLQSSMFQSVAAFHLHKAQYFPLSCELPDLIRTDSFLKAEHPLVVVSGRVCTRDDQFMCFGFKHHHIQVQTEPSIIRRQ